MDVYFEFILPYVAFFLGSEVFAKEVLLEVFIREFVTFQSSLKKSTISDFTWCNSSSIFAIFRRIGFQGGKITDIRCKNLPKFYQLSASKS